MSIKINSIEQYIAEVRKFSQLEGTCTIDRIFYRGQSNSSYKIVPSLGRPISKDSEPEENYIPFENDILNAAKLEYPDIFDDKNNEVDIMALVQHYGMPTRLLDVTENPLVALYFACSNPDKGNDGEVIIFQSGSAAPIMTSFQNDEILTMEKSCFIRSKKLSERQKAQSGLFLRVSDVDLKLGEIPKELSEESVYRDSIIIATDHKSQILRDLKLMGISERTLFPEDIDKGCRELLETLTKNAYGA